MKARKKKRELTSLEHAAQAVIDAWENGDLAGAVNQLEEALEVSLENK